MLVVYVLVVLVTALTSCVIWNATIKTLKNVGLVVFFMTLGFAILAAFVHLF